MDGVDFERAVLETVKASEKRGEPPLVWTMELGRYLREMGLGFPNLELGQVLVKNLCFGNNTPFLWKLLGQALASRLISPLHTLALLTSRVIPHHKAQPEAYRLYLELLSRYFLSFSLMGSDSYRKKLTKSVDNALQLSHTYGVNIIDLGNTVVLFLFSVVVNLIYSTLEDWGVQLASIENDNSLYIGVGLQDMDIDAKENSNDKRIEQCEQLRRTNAAMAMEVVEKITANEKARILLRLVHLNMPEKFNCLLQRLQLIEVQKTTLLNLISANCVLERLFMNIKRIMEGEFQLNKSQLIGVLVDIGSSGLTSYCSSGAGQAACWVPFDIFMENAMDGKHLYATSAIDILTELTKTLQVINQASWQETFQALWISALRLVQRDREPKEGPIPHLDARLCVLLSITPLAIASVIKEEGDMPPVMNGGASRNIGTDCENGMEGNRYVSRKQGSISSLRLLGQFTGLLSPPPTVVNAANNAAAKAASYLSNFKNGNDSFNGTSHNNTTVKAAGNMLHLIVEACIARKLVDTSAYFWPGYVVTSATSLTDSMSINESPWSTFMDGVQLAGPLKNALIATPATSVPQVEKLYHIALNGSEEERAAAAKILCGASLSRGWNIQEHVVHFVVRLLSPPMPSDFSGTGSHLLSYMSMLNSILRGASCIDIVHIISLYGMVPEVAAALTPLCEVFGSLSPTSNCRSSTSDDHSVYSVFSCAFLFLLRLWKFYRPPQEHCVAGRGVSVGVELTLDYLLLLHNSRTTSHNSASSERITRHANPLGTCSTQPVYIASFPKLRAWYFQNQACIASTLSGVCSGNPVHQIANKILHMICRKMTKGGVMSGHASSTSSGSTSGSPVNTGDDAYQRPIFPAWEVLEAIPFVVEAVLTACAHGKLSSRDLTTGLRDLVDFLPASLASIISYFSAEITRGIWKPVLMNGIDWPSPASNLLSIESEIKDILASAGVYIPSSYAGGTTPVMLPLPMAALVSLTITFKLDKNMEYIHAVAGPALENCATGCPWPSMHIVGALWAQKVRRWHNFILMSCSRSPFKQDQEAISQLLRSCFRSFLGAKLTSSSHITPEQGVNGLLGHAIGDPTMAPGFLYLRSCRMFHDMHFVNDEIVRLVVENARESAPGRGRSFGSSALLRSTETSLASAAARAKEIATLGASLLCIAGGIRMVQVLYEETMPTWLLTTRELKSCRMGPTSRILEGYAMAYMLILSGSFVWGVGRVCPAYSSACIVLRARAFGMHMDFVAGVLDGNISLGCDPATWKAYVSCCVGLVVHFVPAWVTEVKQETLRKLATGLTGWHESQLALALLERGGLAAMTSVVESIL